LNELLKSDVCADVVSYYDEHGRFDEITQKKFMRIMCDELLKGPRASNGTISKISSDACLVFLTEDKVCNATTTKNIIDCFYFLGVIF
jgi:hypothetical protein